MTREEAKQWVEAMKSTLALPLETYEAIDRAIDALSDRPKWIPADVNTPYEIGAEHVLVTIKWAEDDYEVCEMDPIMMPRYNIIAWMPLPEPYKESDNK